MKKTIVIGLLMAVLFQLIVLVGMVGLSAMPLWTGKEIKEKQFQWIRVPCFEVIMRD